MIYLVPADREAKPVRCNPNEDTDGKFIPAEHIVQFVDKAAYTLRGSFSRHHRETIELDSFSEKGLRLLQPAGLQTNPAGLSLQLRR